MSKFDKLYSNLKDKFSKIKTLVLSNNLENLDALSDEVVNDYYELLNNSKSKKHLSIKRLISNIGICSMFNEKLKSLVTNELKTNDFNSFDLWKDYIEDILYFHSYRIYNYEFLSNLADYYFEITKFDNQNYVHRQMLNTILEYHSNGIINYYPAVDNTYNVDKVKPLIDFLSDEINKNIDMPLCISNEQRNEYLDSIKQQIHSHFKENYIKEIAINFDTSTKFKLPKKYNTNILMDIELLKVKYNPFKKTDYQINVDRLLANPNPFNLYYYLIDVMNGEVHYTCLDKLINDIFDNVSVSISNVGWELKNDNICINIINKYFMMYFGIAMPKNRIKAIEYLGLNMETLTKQASCSKVIIESLSYDMHSIIANNPTNSTSFNTSCLNVEYLNETKLIQYLDLLNEDKLYAELKYFKENNQYIFNDIIKKYKKIYDKGLEADKEKELELLKQAEIEKEKQLRELEKQKIEKEILEKKQKQSEKLKESINRKNENLTDEQLNELMIKTDDVEAMSKVASHYFSLGDSNVKYYDLAYHYYNIAGDLGNDIGYLNAAIAKINKNTVLEKGCSEYLKNIDIALKNLEKAKLSASLFFMYSVYTTLNPKQEYIDFIETSYNKIINDDKYIENAKTLTKSAYYFYKEDYINCIIHFDLVKESVNKAILSLFTNHFYDKLNVYAGTVKHPKAPEIFNPFSEEYNKYNMELSKYLDVTNALNKAKNIIEWASSLNDVTSIKYKGFCLYYGYFNYEKDHKQAYEIFYKYQDQIKPTEKAYIDIYEKLKIEFKGKKRK